MAGEEGVAFSAGRKIFRHCYGVDEDNNAAAGKGRLLLISSGTMKTPLLPLHGSVVISFMAETGDHDGAAEDFVDVALVHHAGAELLLEDDLSLMSLLRAGVDG